MAKPRDIVAEIALLIPEGHSSRPWWLRLTEEQAAILPPIKEAWMAGRLGKRKATAARAISSKLKEFGINIGTQGVLAWLERG
jgi:hypothetical protein